MSVEALNQDRPWEWVSVEDELRQEGVLLEGENEDVQFLEERAKCLSSLQDRLIEVLRFNNPEKKLRELEKIKCENEQEFQKLGNFNEKQIGTTKKIRELQEYIGARINVLSENLVNINVGEYFKLCLFYRKVQCLPLENRKCESNHWWPNWHTVYKCVDCAKVICTNSSCSQKVQNNARLCNQCFKEFTNLQREVEANPQFAYYKTLHKISSEALETLISQQKAVLSRAALEITLRVLISKSEELKKKSEEFRKRCISLKEEILNCKRDRKISKIFIKIEWFTWALALVSGWAGFAVPRSSRVGQNLRLTGLCSAVVMKWVRENFFEESSEMITIKWFGYRGQDKKIVLKKFF